VDPSELPENSIAHYMTPNPVVVPPTMPITKLSRGMLDAHFHRLFVVQEQGRPIGIVSCTNIMRAVAHTAEEGYEGTVAHTFPAERLSRAGSSGL